MFGIAAYNLLPVAALPRVDFPTIVVSASYPGASPSTMASSVATPLEQKFAALPGLAEMSSTSGVGKTTITLQFDLDRNIDAAAQDVQQAIQAATGLLPAHAQPAALPQDKPGGPSRTDLRDPFRRHTDLPPRRLCLHLLAQRLSSTTASPRRGFSGRSRMLSTSG